MASNSKKRRRVLGVSCILAALIIASSSFAWFTSKDEVTNRLSAQADFGVKIVESFAPPKNMLPGQEVNKDVYATNTGSIPAFVKEEVSTVMTVTIEKNTPDLVPGKSVEIKDDERYAVEAGSFLAYKPNGSQKVLGEIVVARPGDKTETEKLTFDPNNTVIPGTANGQYTDFVPDVAGLYVFRRVINVATDGKEDFKTDGDYNATDVTKLANPDGTAITDEDEIAAAKKAATVGYDAYYFVPGATAADNKYYKVSNLSVVPDNTPDKADDNLRTDGLLLYASAGFVEEEQKVLDPMDLKCVTYNAAEATAAGAPGEGKYLVAAYDTGDSNYEAKFKVASDLYDKAIHQFEYATALQQAALTEKNTAVGDADSGSTKADADFTAASAALSEALNNPVDHATAPGLKATKAAYEDALVDRDNKDEKNKEAKKDYEDSMLKLYGKEDGGTTGPASATPATGGYKTGSLYDKYQVSLNNYNTANTNYSSDEMDFLSELKAYNNTLTDKNSDVTGATAMSGLVNVPVSFFEDFKTWLAGQPVTSEEHNYYAATAQYYIDKKNYDEEYAKCFGAAGSVGAPATGSYANTYLGANGQGNASGTKHEYEEAKTTCENAKNAYDAAVIRFNSAVDAYNSAYDDKVAADKLTEEKTQQKADADAIYNAALAEYTRAKRDYESYIASTALKDETNPNNVLRMFIKLANVVCDGVTGEAVTKNDQWQHHPHQVVNDVAEFYYTGILESGETTSKLIDSVTLSSKATTDMYKSFDFDINVAMKSVQVAYDENNDITATATPTELGAFANLKDKTDVETPVKWVDTVVASTAAWT